MDGWHHRFNGHESEQAPEDGGGQGSLACCSPQGCKEFDITERLKNNKEAIHIADTIIKHCVPDTLPELYVQYLVQYSELVMQQQTGSEQEKQYIKAVYCHPAYLIYMQSTS